MYSTVAIGSKIYVIGGYKSSSPTAVLSTVEVFDTVTSTWSAGPAMPTGRFNAGAGVCQGHVYVFGGTKTFSPRLSVVEELDPVTGIWSTAPAMPAAASEMAAGQLSLATSPSGDGIIMATGSGVFGDTLDQNLMMSCERAIVMEGRATGVDATTPAGTTIVSDTGEVSTAGASTTEDEAADVNQPPFRGRLLATRVVTGGASAAAESSAAQITLTIAGTPIVARTLTARSSATCTGSSGAVTIAFLQVGSTVVVDGPVSPDPNTTITVPGVATVVLNQQTTADGTSSHSRAVRAIRIVIPGVADISMVTARAGVHDCP